VWARPTPTVGATTVRLNNLDLDAQGIDHLHVVNHYGTQVMNLTSRVQQANGQRRYEFDIDLSPVPIGTYFIHLKTRSGKTSTHLAVVVR
jgi:hypothetical protein